MISAVPSSNRGPKAKVTCDCCGLSEQHTCDYERRDGPKDARTPNRGQILNRLVAHGWSNVRNTLRCPECEAARKAGRLVAKGEATRTPPIREGNSMSNVEAPMRSPTREQKRQIIDMLGAVYDTDAERYRDGESDVTVAEAIGGGVLFGWVADLREELFGADGRNEEVGRLADDLELRGKALAALLAERDRVEGLVKQAVAAQDVLAHAVDREAEKLAEIDRRLKAVLKAAGPRVRA